MCEETSNRGTPTLDLSKQNISLPVSTNSAPHVQTPPLAQANVAGAQRQLAVLFLCREVKQLRTADAYPPYISVIDVAAAITGKNHDAAAQDFRRLPERYPDVSAKCTDVKFRLNASPAHYAPDAL